MNSEPDSSNNSRSSESRYPEKRHLHVACAVIENGGKVLAAQRSPSTSLPLKWEFPGGKIEFDESPEECLIREIREELGVTVFLDAALTPATHCYPDFTVTLYPFICRLHEGPITMHEHHALQWLEPCNMPDLDWAEADLPVISEYLGQTGFNSAAEPIFT